METPESLGLIAIFQYIFNNWQNISNQFAAVLTAITALLGSIVAVCSLITPLTKTPRDDEFLAKVKNWIHQLSITNAKNVKGVGQDDKVKK